MLGWLDVAYYRVEKEDWRGAAAYLAAHRAPGDVIIGDGLFLDRGGDALRVEQGIGYYLWDQRVVIKAEAGLANLLPADTKSTGTAWGVIWYQGQLADRRALDNAFRFADFRDLLVFSPKKPSGLVYQDTAAILEAMLLLQPLPESHVDLHLALAELYSKLGEFTRAQMHLSTAEKAISADDPRLAGPFNEVGLSIRTGPARDAVVSRDFAKARVLYADLLHGELEPANRFKILMEWAIMERFQSNPSTAIDLLEQALQLRPDDIEAHANYGAVLLDANRPGDAAKQFEIVVSKAPEHFWGYYFGGLAYQRTGRLDEALVALQRSVDLAPDETSQRNAALGVLEVAAQARNCAAARSFAKRFPVVAAGSGETIQAFLAACP
jgi:tetratricopeptide (TPR) repeat protein